MRTADLPLAGWRVLVTRPKLQATKLIELIHEAGGEALPFPTIEIVPLEPPVEQIDRLARADMVIFISSNAVAHGYTVLTNVPSPEKQIVAIGRATQVALEELGCRDVKGPGRLSSSEDLLEQPVLSEVADRRICIVRGKGGREMLKHTLTARGARVSYLECYRRRIPEDWNTLALVAALDDGQRQLLVSVTSVTGLANLVHLTPEDSRPRLMSRPLVVIGDRQRSAAVDIGWNGSILVSGASDEEILRTIVKWRNQP